MAADKDMCWMCRCYDREHRRCRAGKTNPRKKHFSITVAEAGLNRVDLIDRRLEALDTSSTPLIRSAGRQRFELWPESIRGDAA